MAPATQSNPIPISEWKGLVPPCPLVNNWAHRVFVTTNEERVELTLQKMRTEEVVGDVLMGVSGFFLLNIAAIRGIDTKSPPIKEVILFDRSARVKHFWGAVETLMKTRLTRDEAIDRICDLIVENKEFYFQGSSRCSPESQANYRIEALLREIGLQQSWLSDDIKYARIQNLFLQNHVHFFSLDLTVPQGFLVLRHLLEEQQLTLDVLYLSNTFEYTESERSTEKRAKIQHNFFVSVGAVITNRTLIIDAPSDKTQGAFGDQRIQTGGKLGKIPILPFNENFIKIEQLETESKLTKKNILLIGLLALGFFYFFQKHRNHIIHNQ